MKVCCGPRRKGKAVDTTTAATTTTTRPTRPILTTETTTSKSTTVRTTTTSKSTTIRTTITTTTKTTFKKPCKSKLGTSVADVKFLELYAGDGAELEDEDCIENPDAEIIPNSDNENSVEENNPCKSGRLSVADVVVPYSTFGNCTVNNAYQPQCGRHNEVKSVYSFHHFGTIYF